MNTTLEIPDEMRQQLRSVSAEVMAIEEVDEAQEGLLPVLRFRGRLVREAQLAYDAVAPRFRALGFTAMLREEGARQVLLAVPGTITTSPPSLRLALIMFGLTILSTFVTGGFGLDNATCSSVFRPLDGLAFSIALLSILGAHELGHFFVARRLGVAVSFPFFIPLPLLSPFGTMGAFIAMKEPPVNRRGLLAIAVAGPLAGMAVCIPVLTLGLFLSQVQPIQPTCPGISIMMEGNSLLYAALKFAVFGRWLPMGGEDVFLHPVAFAGWAGLLVTALNLMPAGQLDGGHILYALVGPRIAEWTTIAVAGLLVGMGFLWTGWFLWAILIAVFGRLRAAPLNEVTRLDRPRQLLALAGLVLFVLVFTPFPLVVIQ